MELLRNYVGNITWQELRRKQSRILGGGASKRISREVGAGEETLGCTNDTNSV